MEEAIGILEVTSIAMGFYVADEMLKGGEVKLILSRTMCSGKFIVLVTGETAAVTSSVKKGEEIADYTLIDSFIIPNIHPQVLGAIRGANEIKLKEALGILESFSIASLIEGADAAVKRAPISLLEIRLAVALGGKAFVTMTGTVANVKDAIDAGGEVIGKKGLLVNKIVIPNPRPEIITEWI
ncbi:BMC domain-containing protein [candidate division WOR-3 bacterium]|nr:BMC domain-containing protein [candidate division WOR-3 bacterium]